MSEPGRRPARVRVSRSVPLRGRVVSPVRSPDVVSVYDRSLRRAQLRWSVVSVLTITVPLLALPLLAVVSPTTAALPLLRVPLAWWLLAVAVYPAIWLVGRRHVNGAERTETDYRELVAEPSGDDLPDERPGDRPGTAP